MGFLLGLTQFLFLTLFHLHFQAFYCSSSFPATHLCPHDQSVALLQFKNSFSINRFASRPTQKHRKTESWKEGTDCCSWDGVTCDRKTGHVIGLHLGYSRLYGILKPNSTLFSLHHLQQLDLSDNHFNSSHVSSQFGHFFNMKSLSLRNSGFAGQIPAEISHLSRLVSLDLSGNPDLTIEPISFEKLVQNLTRLRELYLEEVNMSLVAPHSLMNLSSSLEYLNVGSCGLQGIFPDNILHGSNLQSLELFGNKNLTGSFPSSNISNALSYLDLSETKILIYLDNSFTSNLKSMKSLYLSSCIITRSNLALLDNLTQLEELDLSYNHFSGQIPSSLANLTQLIYLDLSYNNLSGQIPQSLANLRQLTQLELSYNNFTGQIPSSLANLTQLTYLALSNNNLSGQIPSSLANLAQLNYIDLSTNRLIGHIPCQFSSLSNLTEVHLYSNLLNGTLPPFLFALPFLKILVVDDNLFTGHISPFKHNTLENINLSLNNLSGPIPSSVFEQENLQVLRLASNNKLSGEIPSSVCKLKSLQILDLSNNSIGGFLPQCLGNFSNSLQVLHLGANHLQGTIPATFTEGNILRYLNFNDNELEGEIPPSIVNCKYLQLLDLGNNKIEGTFPDFLEMLPQLQVLVLRSNELRGFLKSPTSNHSFYMLSIFDLSNNLFTGPLPTEYFNNMEAMMKIDDQQLKYMDAEDDFHYSTDVTLKGLEVHLKKIQTILTTINLSGNKFTGGIPGSIGKLRSLEQLNLSHNCLTGYIQPTLGELANLESLDLSSNNLTGRIPEQLANLTFLQVLNLSYNRLEGPIPAGKQFNTFDRGSYEGNLGLCGFPMTKECYDGDGQKQPPSNFQGEGDKISEEGFGWKAVAMGYGCGVPFGLLIGYFVFRTRKPSWFVRMVEGDKRQKAKSIKKTASRNDRRRS